MLKLFPSMPKPRKMFKVPSPQHTKKAVSGFLGGPSGFKGGPWGAILGPIMGGDVKSFNRRMKLWVKRGL